MVTVILCVFLLSYMYGEGKSNYFSKSQIMISNNKPLTLRRGQYTGVDILGCDHGLLLLRLQGGGFYGNRPLRHPNGLAGDLQDHRKRQEW